MADNEKQFSGGTLMRGADGGLYFIPDDDLEAFRLPDKKATAAKKLLGTQNAIQDLTVLRGPAVKRIGLRAADTTTVSVVNIGAIRQRKA